MLPVGLVRSGSRNIIQDLGGGCSVETIRTFKKKHTQSKVVVFILNGINKYFRNDHLLLFAVPAKLSSK